MPPSQQPLNVRQRRVARALRKWRANAGLNQDDVIGKLGWSMPKLSRFENAKAPAGPAEIIALATILGVGEDERDRTVRLAVSAKQGRDEWGTYGPESLRGDFKDFVEDEAEAVEIRAVEIMVVTGLLQAPDYSEALVRRRPAELDESVITERKRLRQQRQQRLDDVDAPLKLHAVLHENTLRLPIGGPSVMEDQMEHLLARAEVPNITIQVLPMSLGAYPRMGNSYHLVYFEDGNLGAAYQEGVRDGTYIEDEDELQAYSLNFERLRELALDPKKSAQRIAEIKRAWS